MKIFGDYHMHSRYSKFRHGKNTIAEIVEDAHKKGLKEIAITDHGPRHLFFGVRKNALKSARREIDELQLKYPDMKIYLGLEANLITETGKIDVNEDMLQYMDICLLGFHKGAYGKFSGLLNLGHLLGNKKNPRRIKRNTDAYIKAIENNKINVITHPNEYIYVDAKRLAEACAKHGVLIEINNRHLKLNEEDIKKMLETDVKFILDSDAHRLSSVGKVDTAIAFAERYIPEDRIVNIHEVSVFGRGNRK